MKNSILTTLVFLIMINIVNAQENTCTIAHPDSVAPVARRILDIYSQIELPRGITPQQAAIDSVNRWQPSGKIDPNWVNFKRDIISAIQETKIEIINRNEIQEDLDNRFKFIDDITSEGILSLEGMTSRIISDISDADGVIFGETHDIKQEKDAVAFIISEIRKVYTVGAFLEESGGEDLRLFSSGQISEGYRLREYPQLDLLEGIRILKGFQPGEQYFTCPKISEIFDLLNTNELLLVYVGSAHTTRVFVDYLPEYLKGRLGVYPTVDDCFQNKGKRPVLVVMNDELRILDAIQNDWLNKLFGENTNPEVLLEKTEIFKNVWDQKMIGYPNGNYFAQHPIYKNIYFGVFSSDRNPRIIKLFEKVLMENEEMRERLRRNEFDSVRVSYDAKIDWNQNHAVTAVYARVEFINSENNVVIPVLVDQNQL